MDFLNRDQSLQLRVATTYCNHGISDLKMRPAEGEGERYLTWLHYQVTVVADFKHHVPQDSLGRWQRPLEPVAYENMIHAHEKRI